MIAIPSPRTGLTPLALVMALLAAGCGGAGERTDRPGATNSEESRAQLEAGGACGDVAFAPRSDNGAFAVRASGVDCATARRVAGDAEDREGGAYSAAGFSCRSRGTTGGPLPAERYRCEREGGGLVTFEAG